MSNIKSEHSKTTYKISDIIEELKRLQIERGDLPVNTINTNFSFYSTWPEYYKDDEDGAEMILFA